MIESGIWFAWYPVALEETSRGKKTAWLENVYRTRYHRGPWRYFTI